jgi:transposase
LEWTEWTRRRSVKDAALTLMNGLIRGRVLYVAEDRKQSSLDGFWGTLTEEQINDIEAVAMDTWDHVAEADGKIVFDKFHVAKHLGDAAGRNTKPRRLRAILSNLSPSPASPTQRIRRWRRSASAFVHHFQGIDAGVVTDGNETK